VRAAEWRGGRVPVKDYDEPRTKLGAFFSILLGLFDWFVKQCPVGLCLEGHRGLAFR
jgi:hypothetical protein